MQLPHSNLPMRTAPTGKTNPSAVQPNLMRQVSAQATEQRLGLNAGQRFIKKKKKNTGSNCILITDSLLLLQVQRLRHDCVLQKHSQTVTRRHLTVSRFPIERASHTNAQAQRHTRNPPLSHRFFFFFVCARVAPSPSDFAARLLPLSHLLLTGLT